MFINCSNHPSAKWSSEQLKAASEWGTVVDYPFPQVPASADEQDVKKMADEIVLGIRDMQPDAVMCQGEFCLSYAVITGLLKADIKVVAACSERKTKERMLENGTVEKQVVFQFVRFREYVG